MGTPPDLALFETIDVARYPLADGDWLMALRNPVDMLRPRLAPWRQAIVAVSSAAFGTDMSGVWADRFAGDFFHGLYRWCMVFDADRNFVGSAGYRATTAFDARLLYWETSSVDPAHGGHGILVQLQVAAIALESKLSGLPVHYVGRTLSPVVLRTYLRRFGALVTPNLDGAVPPELRRLFVAAAEWLGFDGLDPATGRIRHTYAGRPPLYPVGQEPLSASPEVNAFMATLGPDDGMLLFIGPDAHLA